MTWVAVAVAGAAVVGAVASNSASNKASKASKNAANAQLTASQQSIAEQQREYDQTRQDQLPFLQAGYDALDKEKAFLNGDFSGFMNSPDYKFSLDQEIGALDKSAASHGALYSGGHDADLMKYAGGLADQFANNYWNKLAGQAGQGQVTATNLGALGANEAGMIGQYLTNAGNARASSYINQGNIAAQNIGNIGNAFNQWLGYYQNRPQTMASYTPQSTETNPFYTGGGDFSGDYFSNGSSEYGLGGG